MKSQTGNKRRFLLLCGVIAPIMMTGIIIVLGQITPGYDPIRQMISQLGAPGREYAIVLNGGYAAYGLLMGAAAYGVSRSLNLSTAAGRLAAVLYVHALGTVLLGLIPDSPLSDFNLLRHVLHDAASVLAYVPILVSWLFVRSFAGGDPPLRATAIAGVFIAVINLPMPTLAYVDAIEPVRGLIQRSLFAAAFSWLSVVFVLLQRRNRPTTLGVRGVLHNNQTRLI
ncbi:MAG: hypothetical protein A2147_01855 [Chloroflexi bacterium RBG_16_57_8]|nr:MAG: hypothetical protein A2147_01855 [Chloroflexi bacterium RBG_16_57_8]